MTDELRAGLANLIEKWEGDAKAARANNGMFAAIAIEVQLEECVADLRKLLRETR